MPACFSIGKNTLCAAPVLGLHFDFDSIVGLLTSSTGLSSFHLPQIGSQLHQTIRRTLNLRNNQIYPPPSPMYEPLLSIINPHPELQQGPRLLHELLDASRNSEKCAVDFLDQGGKSAQLSFRGLHTLSDKLSARLSRELVMSNDHSRRIVPVLIPQSPQLYVALLAILKAGGAFCPLQLDAPEERIKFIIKDVQARVVLTTTSFFSKIPHHDDVDVLVIDDGFLESPVINKGHDHTVIHPSPDDYAYVMYTSGSTGQPKGVGISHMAATQSLLAHNLQIPSFRRFLQFATTTFDVSVFEIFFPLYRTSTLVACERTYMLNNLTKVINEMEVDALELTPTVTGSLLHSRDRVPRVKLLLTIGEMLTPQIIEEFGGNSSKKSILWAMYGPTECSIHCTLQPNFQTSYKVGNIGRPLATVSAFVISPETTAHSPDVQILPVGQVGELAVGGHQLATTYLNRPEQTAAAFCNHPTYGRLYRTGDKARMLPDRSLECLGRIISGQVKLRGQRVELGEIEQVILKMPECHNVVSCVANDVLVAFYQMAPESVSYQNVVDHCKRWLPSFMVPNEIVFCDNFPQLPSGKIDRKALRQSFVAKKEKISEQNDHNNFNDETDRQILTILQQVLGSSLTSSSHFYATGLDSLRAIRAASLLREMGFPVEALDLLSSENLKALRDIIETRRNSQPQKRFSSWFLELRENLSQSLELKLQNIDMVDVIPCTPLQESILAEIAINPRAYCNWIELEFPTGYSYVEIRNLLQSLADRTEILRTGFCVSPVSGISYVQIIQKSLLDSQFTEVVSFDREYNLGNPKMLLKPLKIQVQLSSGNPKALLQIPHPLYDGWSVDLLLKDLDDLIHKRQPENRPQFRSIAEYYISFKESNEWKESKQFWQESLAGYSRSTFPNYNGKHILSEKVSRVTRNFRLPMDKMQATTQSLAIHPQIFFQASMAYLLGSYLGIDDVVFGTVTSGRVIPVNLVEEIVGPCIATLPLRVMVSQDQHVKQLLLDIQNTNRRILKHSALPLNVINQACGLNPGDSLFDTLFVWQETLQGDTTTKDVSVVDSADELEFKLTFEVEPRPNCICGKMTFRDSVIPAVQVETLMSQIEELVGFLITELNSPIQNAINFFTSPNLSLFNENPENLNPSHSPAELVALQAERTPDNEALAFFSQDISLNLRAETLTFRSLNSQANQIARFIQHNGAKSDDPVCIFMEKSVTLYLCILAVMKLGLGYLPITPETPRERLQWILSESKVKICLTDNSTFSSLDPEGDYKVLNPQSIELSSYSDKNVIVPFNPSDLSYVVFTSGSTGTPKGVLVTQGNLASNLQVLKELYPVPKGSRLLQSCSQAFDVSVFEIFFTWFTGMCLCSASKDDLFNDIEGAIRTMNITHLSLTPTVAALIDPKHVPSVKFLVTAGEAVTEHVRRAWAGRGLYQGYGPSETTNICTAKLAVEEDDLINNIGPPFKNTSAFVMSTTSDQLIPRGGIGELCFGGSQVFRGYLNMPELTAQKIIRHPTYGRIYRSGDLGRLLPDGTILFSGRFDDQVKIRGQRVELGEINQCVLDHQSVYDCATLVIGGKDETRQIIVTFWIPRSSVSSNCSPLTVTEDLHNLIASLFDTLSSILPSYMIPNSIVPVSAIPMTTQSKIDKRRLCALYESFSHEYLARVGLVVENPLDSSNWSELELDIASAISSVTTVPMDEIGRSASIFSMGIDSISAIRLSKLLREKNYPSLSVSVILRNSTVTRLADVISQLKNTIDIQHQKEINLGHIFNDTTQLQIISSFKAHEREVINILPCTPLQEGMLSAWTSQESSKYINRMVFELKIDSNSIKHSWREVYIRHEILRTCFIPTEDPRFAYAQVIINPIELPWEEANIPNGELAEYLEKYSASHIKDFTKFMDPPFRLTLLKCQQRSYLLFSCHHALYDGVAISQLLREIENNIVKDALLPSPVPYSPFLNQMLDWKSEENDKFWNRMLEGVEPTSFPNLTTNPTSLRNNAKSGVFSRSIGISLSALSNECQKLSTSLLAITQAAWVKILVSYLGESDICFGNVVSGRTTLTDSVDELVAPCFNTIPIRINTSSIRTNKQLFQSLQDINAEILPFQFTPLRYLQKKYGADGRRLFDTLFILQQNSYELDPAIWLLQEDSGQMDFALVCEITPNRTKDILAITLHYDGKALSIEEVECIFATYENALQTCYESPSFHPLNLSLPDYLRSVSNENFTTIEPNSGPLMHSAFEQIVLQSPNRVALDFLGSGNIRVRWTFAELNDAGNRIAHILVENKVQLEDSIAICMPKCPSFYAGVLGVLKSGAAFTPFDPLLPVSRKKYMIQELGAKILLISDDVTDVSWCTEAKIIDISDLPARTKDTISTPSLSGHNLAYRLYTSGSTGKPKAVSVEHRNPIQTVESSRHILPWDHDSRLLQYAATTFDMCYYDCFLAWSFGFCLCAADQSAMLNDLPRIINALGVTILDLTPSVALSVQIETIPDVKYLYCIGEAMPHELVKKWNGKCVNSYGPTEAAFCCTIFPVKEQLKSSIIGKPFKTTSFRVMSKFGDFVTPVLGIGELLLGGSQLARAYHNNDELSKSRFILRNGERFYRTGDMVRMLYSGEFEFIGRIDDQVKIRGLRVELGEINNVLHASHAQIKKVSTHIFRAQNSAKEQIVSFIEIASLEDTDWLEDIKQGAEKKARDQLPSYMVPNFFIPITHLPLSVAGKVDKMQLQQIFIDCSHESSTPRDEDDNEEWSSIESKIRDIFSILSQFSLQNIRKGTLIYQLGLDSISAVQIAARLRKEGVLVSATDVLNYPTCKDLALKIANNPQIISMTLEEFDFNSFDQEFRKDIQQKYTLADDDVESVFPCTPFQCGTIALFLQSEGQAYFNYLSLELERNISIENLRSALNLITEKHDMLRTGFTNVRHVQTSFAMICYSISRFSLPLHHIKSADYSMDQLNTWRKQAAADVLGAIYQPPWRILAVDNGTSLHLHIGILHALYDAQSLEYIFEDISASLRGLPISSPGSYHSILSSACGASALKDDSRNQFWVRRGLEKGIYRFPSMTPLHVLYPETITIMLRCSKNLQELNAGCREKSITLQAAGQAAWARILTAYTGEPSVTFGIVLSGRTTPEAEAAAFPCIVTLPVIFNANQSSRLLLDDIMAYNSIIREYQFTPLTEIQRLIQHRGALFDTLFAYQKLSRNRKTVEPWKLLDEKATADYSVSLELEPQTDGNINIRATYLTSILPTEQAVILLQQYDALLTNIIFGNEEEILVSFEKFPHIYSISPAKEPKLECEIRLLHEFVEHSAKKVPGRIAFEFATQIQNGNAVTQAWSYGELNSEGNRIANLIISRGIRPGSLIAICFDKCPEASFAILGILKAGCAFVALDPSAPIARRKFIVEDSGAQILFTTSEKSDDIQNEINICVINLDTYDTGNLLTSQPSLAHPVLPDDLSYCLYTSGTTGTPKGCEITHENAVQAMLAFQRLFAGHWTDESRWLQFASFHFDVSVLEQFWSWSVGIRVVSAPRDLLFEDLPAAISGLGVTHIDLTPSLAKLLHPDDVPSLCKGVFITGGEQLKQEILDVWGPQAVIYNGYGPTEATIGVTMYPRVPSNGKPSNIGPQFDNVGSYVFKPGTEEPVLRGALGELCVSGKLVGKGYLNRPDLTKERFPYLAKFNEKVYRTGDLVRLLHDGCFEFVGRADDQVKLRGQRLEVEEINSVIKQTTREIIDVATFVIQHPSQQKEQLVSFIVIQPNKTNQRSPKIDLDQWNSKSITLAKVACQTRLPGYMVPTYFVPLTSMPLSANNKADSRRIKELYSALTSGDLQDLSNVAKDQGKNWSTKEARVLEVLRDMKIELNGVHRSTSIFELGLDSISVIEFVQCLKAVGFTSARVAAVMKAPTIGQLSKIMDSNSSISQNHQASIISAKQAITVVQRRYQSMAARYLRIGLESIESIAPCTPLQLGMISRSLDNDEPLYFGSFKFSLSATTSIDRLRKAWETVFERAQILRTSFISTDDGYIQVVAHSPAFPWVEYKISEDEDLEDILHLRTNRLWNMNRQNFIRPFEVALGQTPIRTVMSLNIFHGLYDGICLEILLRKVMEEYSGEFEPDYGPSFHEVLPYGPLRTSEEAESFWTKHIASSEFQELPSLIPKPEGGTSRLLTKIEVPSSYGLIRKKLSVTDQAIFQACWAIVLQKYYSYTTTLGIVVSGRSIDYEGAEKCIGPMFNTIPFQLTLDADDTWASIARKCQNFNTEVIPFQHTSLRDIIKWSKRSPGLPLFETLFVFQKEPKAENHSKYDLWEHLEDEFQPDYPLAFEAIMKPAGSIIITTVAHGQIANDETLHELTCLFEKALDALVHNSTALIHEYVGDVQPLRSPVNKGAFISKGHSGQRSNGNTEYHWSKEATRIRQEISILASIEESEIQENTTIFEVGLDSIDAIKLSSRLRKHDITMPVSTIMRCLNISEMVKKIAGYNGYSQEQRITSVARWDQDALRKYLGQNGVEDSTIQSILPATPLQESMMVEMLQSNFERYFNHDVLKLEPDTDLERLLASWATVMEHSPILRTSLHQIDDPEIDVSFVQVVYQFRNKNWGQLEAHSETEIPSIIENIRTRALKHYPNSNQLFELTIVKMPSGYHLILSIAHALYDGYSLGLLHHDVRQAYQGNYTARPGYEPVLLNILDSTIEDSRNFWQDFLLGATPTHFPVQITTIFAFTDTVHRLEKISSTSVSALKAFCRRYNISLQSIGQTCWSFVLASYMRRLEVTFGVVLSGRDLENATDVLFPTMNTVAMPSIIHGSRVGMLKYTQEMITSMRGFQHFPLRKAQSLVCLDGNNLFNTLFIYQKGFEGHPENEPSLFTSINSVSHVEFPICIEMEDAADQLIWRCACKDSALNYEKSEALVGQLDSVLQRIIEAPNSPSIRTDKKGLSICELASFREEKSDKISTSQTPHSAKLPAESFQTSLNPIEEKIRAVLSLVSKLPEEDISKNMSIFYLGLDSISAIKVSSLLKKQSVSLSVSEMLQAATLAKMAEIVDAKKKTIPAEEIKPERILRAVLSQINREELISRAKIAFTDIERILPAAPGQVYMISVWQRSCGTLFYPEFKFAVHGVEDIGTLQAAWRTLVMWYPSLRTVLLATGQNELPFIQVILRSTGSELLEISENTILKDEDRIQQPLVAISAQRTGSSWFIRLRIHHALYDGVSLPILIRHFRTLCQGTSISPPSTSCFSIFLALGASEAARNKRRAFWTTYLNGLESSKQLYQPIASKNPPKRVELFQPATLSETDSITQLAKTNGLTLQALFLAAYAKTHAALRIVTRNYSYEVIDSNKMDKNQDTVVFGIYLANRSHPIEGLPELPAPTVNLVPLRVRAPLQTPLLDIAMQIQKDLQEISSVENSAVGLWEIQSWSGVVIDAFVNFLRLPDQQEVEEGEANQKEEKEGDHEKEEEEEANKAFERVIDTTDSADKFDEHLSQELKENVVKDAYLHAIDIEATVTKSGALDVGVFAPEQMLTMEEAKKLISDLRAELLDLHG